MVYVYRVRRLVKIVFDETNNPTASTTGKDNRPDALWCSLRFQQLNKKYNEDIARITFAMATGDNYLDYDKSTDPSQPGQRVRIKSEGLKLIISPIYFINELAGTVGKISPIATWTISLTALVVSIIVAILKQS